MLYATQTNEDFYMKPHVFLMTVFHTIYKLSFLMFRLRVKKLFGIQLQRLNFSAQKNRLPWMALDRRGGSVLLLGY